MNPDVIKSYLVSLGFDINHPQLNQFQNGVRQSTQQIEKLAAALTGGSGSIIPGGLAGASTAVVVGLSAIGISTLSLMSKTAQADMGFQLYARRMFMSTDAARQLKIATDALGYSLEDIVWGPKELQDRFHLLLQDQKDFMAAMGGSAEFEKQMRRVRDVEFEFTRLKTTLITNLPMALTSSLSRALFGDEDALLKKLREFNSWFIKNSPQIADSISKRLAPALRDIWAIFKDIGGVIKDVVSGFISFTGWISGIDKLKSGQVSVENMALAFERWVKALRNIADTAKEIWDSPWRSVVMGAAGGAAVGSVVPGVGTATGALVGGAAGLGWELSSKSKNGTVHEKMAQWVIEAARKNNIDPALLMGLIDKESSWNPTARNPQTGAFGLMQLMPKNFNMYGEDARIPQQNLDIGARYLSDLIAKHHGDVRGALKDYGGFVTKDPTEYQNYILNHADNYRKSLSLKPTSYSGSSRVDVGGITIHVNQPHATADQIAQTVVKKIDEKMGRITQQNLTQLSGTFA